MIININKSYLLATVVTLVHFGAIIILLILPVAWWFQAAAIALVSASLFRLRRDGVFAAQGLWRIHDDGTCLGPSNGIGTESITRRVVEAIRYPGWVCLRLAAKGRRTRMLLILRDAVDAHTYRQLCARIEQNRLPVPVQSPI